MEVEHIIHRIQFNDDDEDDDVLSVFEVEEMEDDNTVIMDEELYRGLLENNDDVSIGYISDDSDDSDATEYD